MQVATPSSVATRPILPTATLPPTTTPTPSATATATKRLTASEGLGRRTPVAYEHNPRALLVEADISRDSALRGAHVPLFRLYADGYVVFAGDWTPLTTGLDAAARVGRLADSDIQDLLGDLRELGFFALNPLYQPKAASADMPVAHISVYLDKAKTVSVVAPDAFVTPPDFSDAFDRILQSAPTDAKTFTPTDGYLLAQAAGAASDFRNKGVTDWSGVGVRLADATDGITLSGNAYSEVVAFIARTSAAAFYREGDRVYRVLFAPNLPRVVHLTNWLGTILAAPREFEGRAFDIVGYYRGWNLLGEAVGSPPVTRSDWVLADDGGAMYVTGALPEGLTGGSRADAWTLVRVRAVVVYVRLGTSHLQARTVQILARDVPSITPTLAATLTITATRSANGLPTASATPTIPSLKP